MKQLSALILLILTVIWMGVIGQYYHDRNLITEIVLLAIVLSIVGATCIFAMEREN
jgi:uncharacterized membrane protein YhaH (DUF805 family)